MGNGQRRCNGGPRALTAPFSRNKESTRSDADKLNPKGALFF